MQLVFACPLCAKPTAVYVQQFNRDAICQRCGQAFTAHSPVCQVFAIPSAEGRPEHVSVSPSTFNPTEEYVQKALEIAYMHFRKRARATNGYEGDDEIEQMTRDALEDLYAGRAKFDYRGGDLDSHETIELAVGYRRAKIDVEIAPMIAALWRVGMDTINSCQSRPESFGNAGWAYVEFARRHHAKFFIHCLKAEGIETKYKDTEWSGGRLPAGRVTFPPQHIEKLTALFEGWLA